MNERDFRIEAPPVPEHFIEARERALHLIQCGTAYGAKPKRSFPRAAVPAVIAMLLLAASAAAAAARFGILDFLSWSHMTAPEGAQETFVTDLGKVEGDLYAASVEEAYFDGVNFVLIMRYEVKDPQEMLFVNELQGLWRDDEGFYSVHRIWELGGPEDPWQSISEYEDEHGGTRARISAIHPEIIIDGESWGGAGDGFHQPDGSLISVLQGTFDQPTEGPVQLAIRCGAVPAGTEKPTEYDEITITLKPSETVWQAEYMPASQGEGWAVESLKITAGRMLMQAEVEYSCEAGVLAERDFGSIAFRAADGSDIPVPGGGGGEINVLPDGGVRAKWSVTLLTTDGQPDVLKLYLERDGALPLGPIECRLTEG